MFSNCIVSRFYSVVLCCFFLCLLCSCSGGSDSFSIDGRFINFNNGELYIYSIDGGIDALDTISVRDGRFSYHTMLSEASTFVIVFPNFSEVAIFGAPGASVRVRGDANSLNEIEIKGGDENRLMNGLRRELLGVSPSEMLLRVEKFVRDNPSSLVCHYVISKYLLRSASCDYDKALSLLQLVGRSRPEDKSVRRLANQVSVLGVCGVGDRLPEFFFRCRSGKTLTRDFCRGKVGVISLWAEWDYESQSTQRTLVELYNRYPNRFAMFSFSLDMSCVDSDRFVRKNGVSWAYGCDGDVWGSDVVRTLGLQTIDDNIIISRDGRIVARGVPASELESTLVKLLD